MKNIINKRMAFSVATLMVAATSQAALVGHWTFDETSGATAADSSGNGYDGTVTSPVWTDGVVGGALKMNGTDCDVTGFSSDLLSTVSNELTIAFWAAGDVVDIQNMNGFSGYNTGGARWLNAHLPTGTTAYFDAGFTNNISTNALDRINKFVGSGELVRGPWNHWAFTKDATTGYMAMYQNGVLLHDNIIAATGPFNGHMAGITEFFIGSEGQAATRFYKGRMDDFRVYDNELSDTDIADLYNAVTLDYAIAYPDATPTSGYAPLDVVFDGSGSFSTTSITGYSWDFGGGNTATGMIASNTYTTVGTNTATLTVTDENGNTDSSQIEIVTLEVPPGFPIKGGDTIAIDFGGVPGSGALDAATPNYNVAAHAGVPSWSEDYLVRLADGSNTLVSLDIELINGNGDRNLGGFIAGNGGNTNDASIYGDALITWDGGGATAYDSSIILTFTGLDDSLTYNIVGGAVAGPSYTATQFETDWTIGDTTLHSDASAANGYVTFTEVSSTGGVLVVTILDTDYRVCVSQLELFAVPTVADEPILTYEDNTLSWNANWSFNYSVQSNLNLTVGGGWATVTNVVGTPPSNSVALPPQAQNVEFYRVIVE